jgi:DNA primase
MAIPQSFIQELLARVDIVDVVGKHVQLKKGGANFMGLCPFHGEKSPSFSVSPTKQFYHCFGCGVNGNAIGFLMEHTGASFVEAVKDLAAQCGLHVPEEQASPEDRARAAQMRQKQTTLTDVLEKASGAYAKALKDTPRAVDYLKRRGLTGQIAKTFGLGYAPEGWRHLANVFPDYGDAMLTESGLVIEHEDEKNADGESKRYDRFRDRIMFPIRNVKGECIGFGGRVLDKGEPKYLNSPETPVFSKGRELYGLFEARTAIRQAGYCLVTEGYMDVVALAQLGFAHAVATLGTACTPDHVQKLFRFTDAVVFSFDGDGAGRRAARKALDAALPWATDTRSVKFLFLPAEHDPDSFIREHGTEGFAAAVQQAVPLSRFLIDAASADCDLSTAEGRARMAAQARPLWNALPDGALKRQILNDLADKADLDAQDLAHLWQDAAPRQAQRQRPGKPSDRETNTAAATQRQSEHTPSRNRPAMPTWSAPLRAHGKKGLRRGVTSRADRVVGLLLANSGAWDTLNADDHHLLATLDEPHGPLLQWLEMQLHEHGPQPWAALREGLRGHAHEGFALAQVEQATAAQDADAEVSELTDVMARLRLDEWQRECNELAPMAAQDEAALHRYKELLTRISQEKAALAQRG